MAKRSFKKDISSFKNVLEARFLGRRFPLSVTFLVTTRCNYRCQYCDVFSCEEPEMTTKEVFSMIDQLALMGTRRLGINGGEPLLREDIGDIIRYAKTKGFIVTMFTNGSLVAKTIDKIQSLDVLIISLDGPEALHDEQRFLGSYQNVIGAIDAARTKGIPVWASCASSRRAS